MADTDNDTPPAPSPPTTRAPIPTPRPAYLPTSASSPLTVNKTLYINIQRAPRIPLESFTLPPRSGCAWACPAKSIVRISTPSGPQVGDLNLWARHDPAERFWAARTKQLHQSHLSTHDRLWSCLPYLRPLATIIHDTLDWYGVDEHGARCHDLLGTRCDPYVNVLLAGPDASDDRHCHSNLTRAIAPWGLAERDVHDVINLFQVTGLDARGRYFMNPSPARPGDYIEFFCEVELLMALSTCPGGDLSQWGFGKDMVECCRPLKVEVWTIEGEEAVLEGWTAPEAPGYKGNHGMKVEDRGEI